MVTADDLRAAADRASAATHVAATIRINMAFANKEGMRDVAVVLESAMRLAEREHDRAFAVVAAYQAQQAVRPKLRIAK